MKKIILLCSLCLTLAACKTGGVYDPVKTEKVRASIKPVVSTAVRVWLASEPNPVYRDAAKAFADVVCQMRDEGEFRASVLTQRLNAELAIHGLLTDLWAATAKDLIIAQFEIFIADKVRADLPPDQFAWNLLDVLCEGIRSGIGDTGLNLPLDDIMLAGL